MAKLCARIRSFLRISRSCQIQDAPFANFAFKDLRSLGRKTRDTNQEEQEYITWKNFSFLKNERKYTYRASSILQSNLSWRERRVSPVNARASEKCFAMSRYGGARRDRELYFLQNRSRCFSCCSNSGKPALPRVT